jgi:hypothetical protein
MQQKIEFKLYSHYRCGSCLTKLLVEKHLDRLVHSEALGNKHEGFNKRQFDMYGLNGAPHIKLLISLKHPYSWVVSFSKWTIRNEVFTDEDVKPLSETPSETIKRWCDSYNHLYKHWYGLPYENYVVVYEDLTRDCHKVLDGIRRRWGLKFKSFPRHVDYIVRPGQEISYKTFDFSYYYEHRYMAELSNEQIDVIRESIDWSFFNQFGYTCEVPKYRYLSDYQI